MSIKPTRKTKKLHIKSALPIYAAAGAFVLFALILPIYKLWAILLSAALAAGCYFALDKLVFTGRDITVTEEILTGDKELDALIKQARGTIESFRTIAEKSGDQSVKEYLTRISDSSEDIIEEVVNDKSDRGDAYTFFSYYMPTLDKLMGYYDTLAGKGSMAEEGRGRIESCLGMVAQAFEKFRDKLYKNEAAEIKVSIEVLKTMLRADGLADKQERPRASGVDAEIDDISKQLQTELQEEEKRLLAATATN
ncbi:MAG: hypothetical protein K5784_05265 [Clostridiales bacterium]|nr:hypothetical protein [Clostridiales bacterium]